jgi:hypothetical protein
MSRSSRPLRPFSLVALACAVALFAASCHHSDKKAATTTTANAVPSTDAKGEPRVSLAFRLGPSQVQSVDRAKPFPPETAKAILKLVNTYISAAVARPLFTGKDATGLVQYFSPSLASRVGIKGRDRAALTDEHVPVITSVTKADKQRLVLVGLQTGGKLVMIGARFGLTVKGETDQGPLAVSRLGNLVFERDAKHQWRISGYSLFVRRDTKRASTTAKATTTTAAK